MTVAGAGGVVFDEEGRVLLLRRLGGSWVFPKGHIDPGEDALQTAVREIAEEAGVHVVVNDPETQFQTHYVNDRGEERTITWFIADAKEQAFQPSESLFPEGGFKPVEEALELLTWPEDRKLLEEVLAARS